MRLARHLALAAAAAGLLALSGGTAAQANVSLEVGRQDRPGRASAYINPDTGAATPNTDVSPRSSCFSPDRRDRQRFSDPGTANRNVHIDACFLDGRTKVEGPATFESRGVGFISACPDPDGAAGPEVAVLSDVNGDGRNDRCFQSDYQETGAPGDDEFHARVNNNTGTAGTQIVTWCSDADRNGCADERNKSTIRIDWSADGTASFDGDRNGNGNGGLLSRLLRILGLGR